MPFYSKWTRSAKILDPNAPEENHVKVLST